jgi:hypothetical protein
MNILNNARRKTMPNWCENQATITGPHPVIAKIKEIISSNDPELLTWMVPQPNFEGDQDWYAWNVENWGTKWDITDIHIDDDDQDDSIEFSFSTAWAPPITAFETWARGQEDVTFELKYFEGGIGFVGTTSYDGEYLDDECVDSNSDPAEYRRIAEEDWGYQFEEEPEPLTEWYKDGVKEKGLISSDE